MLPLGTDHVRALLCACLGGFVQDASRDMLRRSVMVRCGHPLACRTRNAPAPRATHLRRPYDGARPATSRCSFRRRPFRQAGRDKAIAASEPRSSTLLLACFRVGSIRYGAWMRIADDLVVFAVCVFDGPFRRRSPLACLRFRFGPFQRHLLWHQRHSAAVVQ